MRRAETVRVLRALEGRRPPTMLGGWSRDGVPPFRHLVGTILSARSRDETTDRVAADLFRRYPTPAALARARPGDVRRILHDDIGFYRMKARYAIAAARRVLELGRVPDTLEELLGFAGDADVVEIRIHVRSTPREAPRFPESGRPLSRMRT